MEPEIHLLHRGGKTISALDWGGRKPVLLMLHAGGLCSGAFQPLALRIRHFCRPIAVDLRGHGGSSPPIKKSEFSYETLASDALSMLDALGVQSAYGFGHSLGGGALLRAAIKRPGFFERLMICEGAAAPMEPEILKRRTRGLYENAAKRRSVWLNRQELISHYRQKRPFDRFTLESLRAFAQWGLSKREDGQFELSCSAETEAGYHAAALWNMRADGLEQRLAEIPAAGTHCTLLRGLQSPFPEESHQAQIEALKAESVHIDAGHFLPQEEPALVAEVIKSRMGVSPDQSGWAKRDHLQTDPVGPTHRVPNVYIDRS